MIDAAKQYGVLMREQVDKTGALCVLARESILIGEEGHPDLTCESLIKTYVEPFMAGPGAIYVIGKVQH